MEKKNAIKWVIIVFVVCMLSVISWFIYNKVYESFEPGMRIQVPFSITEVPLDSAMQYFIYDSRVNKYFPVSKAMRYRYRLPSTSPGPLSTAYTDVIVYFAETDADILVVSTTGIVRYVIGKFDVILSRDQFFLKTWPYNPKFLSFPNNVSVFLEVRFQNPQSYPLISLNSNSQNGYTVSASSVFDRTTEPWNVFDNNNSTFWRSAANIYNLSHRLFKYQGVVNTLANNKSYRGEWIQIELPDAIRIQSFELSSRNINMNGFPLDFVLLASPDKTNWTEMYSYNTTHYNPKSFRPGQPYVFNVNPRMTTFKVYRLVVSNVIGKDAIIANWKLNATARSF